MTTTNSSSGWCGASCPEHCWKALGWSNPTLWQAIRQYDSTVREATTITMESGMNADGEHGYFVRIRTGGGVTYEEHWTRKQRASERFERVVEEHVERSDGMSTETAVAPHTVAPENAVKFQEWFSTRGGIAIWKSINLSNPGASWTTPLNDEDGQRKTKPTWEAANEPERIITDPAEVVVVTGREVKRFHVAVKMHGLTAKVSDQGTHKVRAAVDAAGQDAWYEFDYESQEAVILVPGESVLLTEWKA